MVSPLGMGIRPPSVFFPVLEFPDVLTPIGIGDATLPVFYTVFPLAHVYASVIVRIGALPVVFTVLVLTDVFTSIGSNSAVAIVPSGLVVTTRTRRQCPALSRTE